jgi:hypothetical protein
MFLAIAFVACQMNYIFTNNFTQQTDKVMQVLIGFGITGAVLLYSIADASRFVGRWYDKLFYATSCLLMKPIFLPVLLPGFCFKSALSNKARH